MPKIVYRSPQRRSAEQASTAEVAAEIKARITIPILAEKLFPGWKPDKSCLSPFREQKNPSFSVYENGRRWKDYTSDKGGDAFDFYQEATGCDRKEAFSALKEIMEGGSFAGTVTAQAIASHKEEKKQVHPNLSKPTDADLTAIYHLRAIWTPALKIAVDRGLLWVGVLKGEKAFVITDRTRKSYNARRIDGKVWDHLPNKPKAWLLYGSNGSWPIGLPEAEPFPAIALYEGGPDFLAAFGHAYASSVQHLVAPVCMSGASSHIPDDALLLFKGKRVRIFVQDDRAGEEAWERWDRQLYGVADKIDGFDFIGLTDTEGSSIGDLNQLLEVDYDCWEKHKETIESVMNFAVEGE
jgi:CHC2 zinc finger